MSDSSNLREIRGVLLPLQSGYLLMPNAAVSEVIGYRAPEKVDSADATWLLGMLEWRSQSVPLISFDELIGQARGEIGQGARIAVCNTLNGNPDLPYVAVALAAVPRLTRVREDLLEPMAEQEGESAVIAARVKINEVETWIPDLDQLEQRVLQQLG